LDRGSNSDSVPWVDTIDTGKAAEVVVAEEQMDARSAKRKKSSSPHKNKSRKGTTLHIM